jgi:hypothetical protein
MADLRNIEAEIKNLENLKSTYNSLLTTEKNVNNAILYSTGVRKRYTDVLTAAADAQKDLLAKEEKLSRAITHSSTELGKAFKRHKALKVERGRLLEQQKKLIASGKKGDKQWKKNNDQLQSIRSSFKSTSSAIKEYEKDMQDAIAETKGLAGNAAKMKGTFDALAKVDSKNIGSFKDLNRLAEVRASIMEKQWDIQYKSGTITKEERDGLKKSNRELSSMYNTQGKMLKLKTSSKSHGMIDELTSEAEDLTDTKKIGTGKGSKKRAKAEMGKALYKAESRKGVSLRGAQMESLKTLFSGKSSFGSKMGAAKSFGSAGKDLNKLNDVMKVTGKSALTAGGTMKMLGSALGSLGKLGWIGLIIQAVGAVANAVNRLDKFLKGFNQTFAKLQGPTVMMGDVGKSMEGFTDAIFDLQTNLKYGLKSEDITGMFQGISESGMSLQGVMKNVSGGYKKIKEDAAKVHLDFGVSMEEAGSMLGEQMTDLKSSVDEASESFKVMAYDASLAGIQSQKFYQATYAAAESLSYYGKFLTTASNTLKNFQQQGGMGFKDAQEQTQEMTNLFGNMDKRMRIAFMDMSGGVEAYRADFVKLEADSAAAIKTHLESLAGKRKELADAKSRDDKGEVARIENEISAEKDLLKTQQKTYAQAGRAAKGNAQDMALGLELLSDKVGEKLGDYFKSLRGNNGPDIFDPRQAAAMQVHMTTILGVSDKFANKMMDSIATTRVGIEQMAKDLDAVLPEGKRSAFKDTFAKIIKDNTDKTGKQNMKAIKGALTLTGQVSAEGIDSIMENLNTYPGAVQEFMAKGLQGVKDNISDIVLGELKTTEQVTGESAEAQNKRLDDLVNNTHTIGDFIGISKENVEYLMANNDIPKGAALAAIQTSKSVGNILSFITGRWGKGKEKILRNMENSDLYRGMKDIGAAMKVLEAGKNQTTDENKKKEYQAEINRLKDDYDSREKITKKMYGTEIAEQIISGAAEAGMEKAKSIFEGKMNAESSIQAKRDEAAGLKDTDPKKAKKLEKEADKMQLDFARQKSRLAYSQKSVELFLDKTAESAVTGVQNKINEATTKPVDVKKDFKATSGGYALLSKGDVVVNARNMSAGTGRDFGAFAGTAASEMMRSMGPVASNKTTSAPSIPVSITIGSVSGNPEEFLRSIKPAIEQAFDRMYYEKQKRR